MTPDAVWLFSCFYITKMTRENTRYIIKRTRPQKRSLDIYITSEKQKQVTIFMIMKALHTKTHYRLKHIQHIIDEMVTEGKLAARDTSGGITYAIVEGKQ